MPPHDTGRVRSNPSSVWTLGDLLGPPIGGTKTECMSRTYLPRLTGNNAGRPSISSDFQHGSGQCHHNMAVHDSGEPGGGSLQVGGNLRAVPGGLIYQRQHGGLTRCGLYTTFNERPFHPLPTVCPCGQRRQVTHNYVTTRRTTAGIFAEAKSLKFTGVGDLYRVRFQIRIFYPECGVELTVGSITAHR